MGPGETAFAANHLQDGLFMINGSAPHADASEILHTNAHFEDSKSTRTLYLLGL
jgi:hypothetical protein